MGLSEMESRCRNHPHQKQLQGVCAACLREKLSHLSASNRQISTLVLPDPNSYSNNSSSLSSPGSEDFSLSPTRLPGGRQRNGSRTVAFMVDVGGGGLRKSRSIAFVPKGGLEEVKSKKKKGFWSKLIPLKVNKQEGMMRKSKTLRERLDEIN